MSPLIEKWYWNQALAAAQFGKSLQFTDALGGRVPRTLATLSFPHVTSARTTLVEERQPAEFGQSPTALPANEPFGLCRCSIPTTNDPYRRMLTAAPVKTGIENPGRRSAHVLPGVARQYSVSPVNGE
jgi:hypothetical protein